MAISFAAFAVLVLAFLLFRTNMGGDHLAYLVGAFFLLSYMQGGMA